MPVGGTTSGFGFRSQVATASQPTARVPVIPVPFETKLSRHRFALMQATLDCVRAPDADRASFGAALAQALDLMSEFHPLRDSVPDRFALAKVAMVALASCGQVMPGPLTPEISARLRPFIDSLAQPSVAGKDPLKLSQRNNHQLFGGVILLLWSGLVDADAHREEGLARIARFVATIDDDGLFPSETVRGASAAWYCNLAVMMLTTAQWIGRCQGQAPFEEEILRRAVTGLASVVAAPDRLHKSARANMYPHAEHGTNPFNLDMRFLHGYHSSRHYMTWVPIYCALYPGATLPDVLTGRMTEDLFPMGNEFCGGFADAIIPPVTTLT